MDDEFRRQTVPARDSRLSGRASTQRLAICQETRSRLAMDRSVDAAAAEQRLVRRVDYRVNLELRDVAFDKLDFSQFSHLIPADCALTKGLDRMIVPMPVPVKLVLPLYMS